MPKMPEACADSRLVSPLEWISVDRLAALLDVRVDHLRALVQRREIPHGKVGKLVRFHWPTIQRWVAENTCASSSTTHASTLA